MTTPALEAPTAGRATEPWPIVEVARTAGLSEDDLELYGRYKAKMHLEVGERLADRPDGRYVAVTAITPTPFGEGKTVTAIGLAEALQLAGHRAFVCLRQPSMGPTFGLKGGGAGGGRAQLLPMVDVNLHLTGDLHAVAAAHNLLAAALDAHLFHGNALGIDPEAITLKRVLDVDDRALRAVEVGVDRARGLPSRRTGFEITAASEVMAILALAVDPADLRARLGRMVVAFDREGAPVTAEQLQVAGAMAVILKDALLPNLVQTFEHSPAFVHAGPFANIAHGNSSIVADRLALKLADYVVTESGFGSDLGFEKLVDVKCRLSGLAPDCAVLVATIRALKVHGGAGVAMAGRPLPPVLTREDLPSLERGCANLARHVQNVGKFGLPVVVAINSFPTDTPAEVALVRQRALEAGAASACLSRVWADGAVGGLELAAAVVAACERPKRLRLLYPDRAPIRQKLEIVAREMYGAAGLDVAPEAERQIERLTALGFGELPVCLAKTHLSLSHDPELLGAPAGFRLPIRELRLSAGAGFLSALCGDIQTMPGLPAHPAFERVDLVGGRVVGLS